MGSPSLTKSAPGPREHRESTGSGGCSLGRGEQLRQVPPEDPYSERSQARRARRLASFKALDLLATFSALDRVRKCRRVSTGRGSVELRVRRGEARAHFAGLQTCGSVWACPCCSERVLAGRADELLAGINAHAANGGEVWMVTLTMRHRLDQALSDLWDGLGEAWRAATSGSRDVRLLMHDVDWARRVEATHGDHGWHAHAHALLFAPAGLDGGSLGEAMFKAWGTRLVNIGFDAPLAGPGMQVKKLDLADAGSAVADYLAKGHYEEVRPTDRRLAALELASAGKRARGRNRTPFQILGDFVANGLASDAELWREWELASKGRKAVTWSRGARKRLVGDVEQTDEQLAEATDHGGEVVACIEPRAWPAIARRPQLMHRLLNLVETSIDNAEAFDRLQRELDGHDMAGALFRPPEVVASWEP